MILKTERKYVMRRLFIGWPLAMLGAYGLLKLIGLYIALLGVLIGDFA